MVLGLWIIFMIDWSSESFASFPFFFLLLLLHPLRLLPLCSQPLNSPPHNYTRWSLCLFTDLHPPTIARVVHPRVFADPRQTGDLPRLAKPAAWLKTRFDIINKTCPQFMRPKYFALVIVTAYKAARKAVVEQCSEFISSGHSFTHDLALAAVQQYGLVKSASINPAKPVPSLAAGLPHFAAGWARCWGRDVVSFPPFHSFPSTSHCLIYTIAPPFLLHSSRLPGPRCE
jgi:hypothetical protein